MRSSTELSSPAPGVLPGSPPSAAATLRLAANDAPEDARPDLLREFFQRLGVRYDVMATGREPIKIDLTLRRLPGLQLSSGTLQGARYLRTRGSTEDVGLVVNPRGKLLVAQCGREITLGEGDATLVSFDEALDTVHRAPGDMLVLRFPRPQLAPRLTDARDCALRRIPHGTPALRMLTDYVNITEQKQAATNGDLQQLIVSHFYDLAAVAIGATRDAAELAQGGGLRAARLHAIKRDIVQNLDRPDLSVVALAPPPWLHAALHPAAVRERRHELYRACADAALGACPPHADRPAPRRRKDQHDRARCRVRRRVLFQPRLPPALWRHTVGHPRIRSARYSPSLIGARRHP